MLYFEKRRKYSMVNIDEYLVKIKVPINDEESIIGSGVIFPLEGKDHDYVITALHCLRNSDFSFKYNKIIITRKDLIGEDEKKIEITNLEKCHESNDEIKVKDFAIIEVEKTQGLASLYIAKPIENNPIEVSCYPNSKEGKIASKKIGKVKNRINTSSLFVEMKASFLNVVKDANEKIAGSSGAGVFQVNGNNRSLIGIITEIGSSANEHNELIMLDINVINNYLRSNCLIGLDEQISYPLKHVYGNIFDEYKGSCDEMKTMLKDEAKNFIDIKTEEIIERIGKDLFFPEDKGNYNDKKLWEGWLEYLTFVYLNSKNDYYDFEHYKLKIEEFLDYVIKDKGNSIKFIYSTTDSFDKIVCSIYRNDENKFYKQLKEKDKVIINNAEPNSDSSYPIFGDTLINIVKDISFGELDNKLSHIDDHRINKQLKFFHLQNIKNKMKNEKTAYKKRHDEIKECIKEILEKEVFND